MINLEYCLYEPNLPFKLITLTDSKLLEIDGNLMKILFNEKFGDYFCSIIRPLQENELLARFPLSVLSNLALTMPVIQRARGSSIFEQHKQASEVVHLILEGEVSLIQKHYWSTDSTVKITQALNHLIIPKRKTSFIPLSRIYRGQFVQEDILGLHPHHQYTASVESESCSFMCININMLLAIDRSYSCLNMMNSRQQDKVRQTEAREQLLRERMRSISSSKRIADIAQLLNKDTDAVKTQNFNTLILRQKRKPRSKSLQNSAEYIPPTLTGQIENTLRNPTSKPNPSSLSIEGSISHQSQQYRSESVNLPRLGRLIAESFQAKDSMLRNNFRSAPVCKLV